VKPVAGGGASAANENSISAMGTARPQGVASAGAVRISKPAAWPEASRASTTALAASSAPPGCACGLLQAAASAYVGAWPRPAGPPSPSPPKCTVWWSLTYTTEVPAAEKWS